MFERNICALPYPKLVYQTQLIHQFWVWVKRLCLSLNTKFRKGILGESKMIPKTGSGLKIFQKEYFWKILKKGPRRLKKN